MFFLYLDPHLLLLWHLVTPPLSHLQAPLCLPVTQNNSKNRHNYSLISWPVMLRAWWNILYPLIFPQGGRRRPGTLIKCSLLEAIRLSLNLKRFNKQHHPPIPLWKHCHFHKPPPTSHCSFCFDPFLSSLHLIDASVSTTEKISFMTVAVENSHAWGHETWAKFIVWTNSPL